MQALHNTTRSMPHQCPSCEMQMGVKQMYLDAAEKKAHDSWGGGFGFKPITHEEYTTLSDKFTLVKMALMPSGTRLLA